MNCERKEENKHECSPTFFKHLTAIFCYKRTILNCDNKICANKLLDA